MLTKQALIKGNASGEPYRKVEAAPVRQCESELEHNVYVGYGKDQLVVNVVQSRRTKRQSPNIGCGEASSNKAVQAHLRT